MSRKLSNWSNPGEKLLYKHKEAFALMWYGCRNCGHLERIWNSRDGVTPFGMACTSCSGTLQHIRWDQDECVPEYAPNPGQRFWRDGTLAEATEILRQRAASSEMPSDVVAAAIAQIEKGTSMEFQPGWPKLDVASQTSRSE